MLMVERSHDDTPEEGIAPPAPPDLAGLTAGERKFCRSLALTGVPVVAFRRAWPGRWRTLTAAKLKERIEALMDNETISRAVERLRDDMAAPAQARLDWAKAKRAQERYEREQRIGIGVREIESAQDRGTPEIQARKRADVVEGLAEQLGKERLMAARQIAAVIEARERGWFSSGKWPDGTRVDVSANNVDPLSGIPEELVAAYRETYLPWLHEIGNEPINTRLTYAGLVYEVAVNNRGLRECEREYGISQGHSIALAHLKDALWRYAVRAGWARAWDDD